MLPLHNKIQMLMQQPLSGMILGEHLLGSNFVKGKVMSKAPTISVLVRSKKCKILNGIHHIRIQEENVHHDHGRELSPTLDFLIFLILGFLDSTNVRNKCLLISHPVYGIPQQLELNNIFFLI